MLMTLNPAESLLIAAVAAKPLIASFTQTHHHQHTHVVSPPATSLPVVAAGPPLVQNVDQSRPRGPGVVLEHSAAAAAATCNPLLPFYLKKKNQAKHIHTQYGAKMQHCLVVRKSRSIEPRRSNLSRRRVSKGDAMGGAQQPQSVSPPAHFRRRKNLSRSPPQSYSRFLANRLNQDCKKHNKLTQTCSHTQCVGKQRRRNVSGGNRNPLRVEVLNGGGEQELNLVR